MDAVEEAFGADVDYAQLQKIYGASEEPDTRYSPAVCIGCDMKVVSGNPDPKHVSTSYVERQNLTMRMGMRRFTRLTNAFSKEVENHAAMVAIHFLYYNFARIQQNSESDPGNGRWIGESCLVFRRNRTFGIAMTRFKELRRIEEAIEHRNEA